MEASGSLVFDRWAPLHSCLEKRGSDEAGSVFDELDAALAKSSVWNMKFASG